MIDFKKRLEELENDDRRGSGDWEEEEILAKHKKKKRVITYLAAIAIIAVIFSGRVLISSQSATGGRTGNGFFDVLRRLIPGADKQLAGESDDRVNILLLGMGGENHDGPYLTDTIMLASLQPSTGQVAMISFPRDLITPVSGWQKINSINAYAEEKQPGSGGQVTAAALSQLLQIPIQYYIRVDFSGFTRVIDELGGVTVNVENAIDDYAYPIGGQEDNPDYYARFEHLHIDKGAVTMDGDLALKYVRSRHAAGSEGSDFARARRQQLLMAAIKDKVLSRQTLLNPVMIAKLIGEFKANISTNLNDWEALRLWNLVKNVSPGQVNNKVLSDAPGGLLIAGRGEDGAYVLTPSAGNFSQIRSLVQNIFGPEAAAAPQSAIIVEKATDNPLLAIANGTWITGLASKTAVELEKHDFNVVKISNAPLRDYTQTTVYDLSYGHKNESLALLKKLTGAKQAFDSPSWLDNHRLSAAATSATATLATASPDILATGNENNDQFISDFLLILGTDANSSD